MEKRKPFSTVDWNANWYNHYGDSLESWKQNYHMTQRFPFRVCTRNKCGREETPVHPRSQHCPQQLTREVTQCPLPDKANEQNVCIRKMEYYSAFKKKKLLQYPTRRMNFENVMLRKTSQS